MERWRRQVLLVLGYLEALIFSGIIFGWPSLVYILQKEGIYSYLCESHDIGESPLDWHGVDQNVTDEFETTTKATERNHVKCLLQTKEFTLLYTVAAIMYGLASIAIGFSLDHFGLWATRFFGSFITTTGFLCLAFASKENSWLLWPAMNLLALGTNQLKMSCYQFTNLWPSHRTTIFYAYGSAFSISATMFTIFQYIYRLGISYKILCLTLTIMSMFTFPVTFLMPTMKIKEYVKVKSDENKEKDFSPENETIVNLLPLKNERIMEDKSLEKDRLQNESLSHNSGSTNSISKNAEDEENIPLTYSLFSVSAVLHLLWHFVNFFMILFYSVSFNSWMYKATDDQNQVAHYTGILGLCQLIGPLFMPLSGLFTDWRIKLANKSQDSVERLALTLQASTFGTAIATIVLLSVMTCKMFVTKPAIYLSMILIAISRPLVHSGCTSYVRTRFPGSHFNRLIGIFTTLVSIIMPVQYPIFVWMFSSNDNFKAANWLLIVALVVSLLSPGHMMIKKVSRIYASRQLNYPATLKRNKIVVEKEQNK